jgi:hypothetical protein
VEIVLSAPISSANAKPGDTFALSLARPIVMDGKVVVPAGAPGGGEVVDAAPPGLGGKPGKLVLAARYIDYGGIRVHLRAFKLGGSGQNNATGALSADIAISAFVPYVGAATFFIPGGNMVYPAGTHALAKLADEVTLPPAPDQAASPALAPAPASTPVSTSPVERPTQ